MCVLCRNYISEYMLVLFRYYAFHDVFVREVLGKKLSKGTKKDLDDISAKTGVTLKSCRRQVNLIPVVKDGPVSVANYDIF